MAEFPASEFRVDGAPGGIRASAGQWSAFGREATDAAGHIRSLDTSLFIGPEGDQYRQGLTDSLPPHLDVTGQAYSTVASALDAFAGSLSGLQTRMRPLASRAPGLWQALQAAQGRLDSAGSADTRHSQALAAQALTDPGGQSTPPDTYHSDTPAASAALSTAQREWNDCLGQARKVKSDLTKAINTCVNTINAAADTRFKHNPHGWGALVSGFKNFVKDHVAGLAKLSGVLKLVSGIAGVLSFIPVIGEAALVVSLVAGGAALAIDASIKFATGKGSWTSILVDGALMAVPFGLGKGVEALRGARGAEALAEDARVAENVTDAGRITPEPVWRTSSQPLYRADNRPPSTIFRDGFRPKNPSNNDLADFVAHNTPSNFVSTSTRSDLYKEWGSAYRYTVDAPGGVDVNATLGTHTFSNESEIAFPGGVHPSHISGAHPVNVDGSLGDWVPNPNHVPAR
ncbi:MAG TPA: hypothetical protein VFX70_15910 [Mycobacteriales bacterium]|nr:hypothetical protein [Mycobacteriales bacterium]